MGFCTNCGHKISQPGLAYCTECGKELSALAQEEKQLKSLSSLPPRLSMFLGFVLVCVVAGYVFISVYNDHNTPSKTVQQFMAAVRVQNVAQVSAMLEPGAYISEGGIKAFIKLLEKKPQQLEILRGALVGSAAIDKPVGVFQYGGTYQLVKHSRFSILNDYKVYVRPGQIQVAAPEGAVIKLDGFSQDYRSGDDESVSIGATLPGIYAYSLEVKKLYGTLYGQGEFEVGLGETVKADIRNNKLAPTREVLQTIADTIDNFNIADTGHEYRKALEYCLLNSPKYKIIKDRMNTLAQNPNMPKSTYIKMIVAPHFYKVKGDRISVFTAEWYQSVFGKRAIVWEYVLSYSGERWLLVENRQLSESPDSMDFVKDQNKIEIIH